MKKGTQKKRIGNKAVLSCETGAMEESSNKGGIGDKTVSSCFLYVLAKNGYLRLSQIVGNKKTKKAGIPPIIPVSRSTWLSGVKSGRYPQPVKISERCTAWRTQDILALIELTAEQQGGK